MVWVVIRFPTESTETLETVSSKTMSFPSTNSGEWSLFDVKFYQFDGVQGLSTIYSVGLKNYHWYDGSYLPHQLT